ncbi:hypothetical protein NQ318_017327 [Aromia moschata]|uniref:Uncharacterized protein n=1 Tax=Aromia moschata TaxID=1265417 RepID=A0AAV8XVK1_9CUCU|nr:hypothetical protein NQ318_017327 [Aromia moschata]
MTRNSPGIFQNIRNYVRNRVDACIRAEGNHFQHNFWRGVTLQGRFGDALRQKDIVSKHGIKHCEIRALHISKREAKANKVKLHFQVQIATARIFQEDVGSQGLLRKANWMQLSHA